MPLTLKGAGILSTSLEGILYGYSVLLFILTMWILVRNRRRRRLNYGMLAASCALLLLSTAEMGVNIARVYQGFLTVGPTLPGGAEQYFADVSQRTFVTKSCLYCLQTLILDGVVILRTYVVWGSKLVIILPIIGYCGLLGQCEFAGRARKDLPLSPVAPAATIGSNIALATASSHAGNIFAVQTGRWITAVYSLTLGTNLSATLLLAFRIWQVTRESSRYRSGANGGPLGPVLRAIIESGAIYSMAITAGLITFVVKSNGVYIVLDMLSPIISIVFNMIIVRIGLASDRKVIDPTTHISSFAAVSHPHGHSNGNMPRVRVPQGSYEMKDITVEITHFLESTSMGFVVDEGASAAQHEVRKSRSFAGESSQKSAPSQPSDDTAV
ncbi:hypothetical protein FKP32DRAFT_1566382 [Trametes sanguinea]|nr:hypothetical protein FKP32DRAFT_1566382 [Trametes sanguinea]